MVIWKYEVAALIQPTNIDMPIGARIVAVGQQAGVMVFWAEVDHDEQTCTPRRFRAAATGGVYPDGLDYHGTVQFPNGLVFHLLEEAI